MSMVLPHRAIQDVTQAKDKKKAILEKVGDLSGVHVRYNRVLLGQYVGSEYAGKKGLILRADTNKEEDIWQGKVGLVLKLGPNAFVDDADFSFGEQKVNVGEWAVYRIADIRQRLTINDWVCLMVNDTSIDITVDDPSIIL